jgi:hypothetical protein
MTVRPHPPRYMRAELPMSEETPIRATFVELMETIEEAANHLTPAQRKRLARSLEFIAEVLARGGSPSPSIH